MEFLVMRHQMIMLPVLSIMSWVLLGPTKSELVRISGNFTCDELLHLEPNMSKIRGHKQVHEKVAQTHSAPHGSWST